METNGRIIGLDLLRGLAVMLMVFGHCVSWGDYGVAFHPYEQLGWGLTGFRMPVLVLISGMLANGMLHADWRRLRARLAHFGWVYLVWMPVVLLFTMTFLNPALATVGADTFAAEFVRPLTVMWFIWVLAIYTGLLFALRRVPRSYVASGAVLVSVIGYAVDLPVFSHANLLRHAAFFFAGALYRGDAMRLVTTPFSWKVMAGLVAGLVPLHLVAQALRADWGWQMLGVPERLVLCAIGLHGVQLLYRLPVAGPLARLGRKTLPVFVAHLPILLLARMVLPDLGGAGGVLAPVVLAMTCIAGSLLVERIAIGLGADWLYARPGWAGMATVRRVADQLPIPSALAARWDRPVV